MSLPVIHLDRPNQAAFTGWSGEAINYAGLPIASSVDGQFWMVLNPSGSRFLFTYKASGLYYSEGGSWRKINNAQLLLNDDQFSVYNTADNTKQIAFDVSAIAPATKRTATWPNKDGVVAMVSDIITDHNSLSGLQGGTVGEYNHLTNAELTSVQSILKQKAGLVLAAAFSGNPKKTAAIVFATTIKPVVSLSKRCTIPALGTTSNCGQ